jgi:hypothetical protein
MNSRHHFTTLLSAICYLLPAICSAQPLANPTLVYGCDCIGVNPAQLAYGERCSYRILDLQAAAGNNAFDLFSYNRYTGAYLDPTAKQKLFSAIPEPGFRLGTSFHADLLDFTIGRFALAVRNHTGVAANVPRDLIDLALWGNALNRTYSASTLSGDAISYCDATLAYGFPLPHGFRAGVGLKYLRGLAIAQNTQVDGYLLTTPYVINSQVTLGYRYAFGGNGFGLDLGATYTPQSMYSEPHPLNSRPPAASPWTFALAILNINTGIYWNQGLQAGVAGVSLDSFSVARINDNVLTSQFVQSPAQSFRTQLPVQFVLGASYRLPDRPLGPLVLGASISEATANSALSSTIPRGTLTAQYRGLGWLPLSVDASIGGSPIGSPLTPDYGLTLGLDLRGFALRARLANTGGLALAAKGASFGLSLTYRTGIPGRQYGRTSETRLTSIDLHSSTSGQ